MNKISASRLGLVVAVVLIIAIAPPLLAPPGILYTLTQIAISGIFASSVGFVIGFAGVPTFGNQLFYGAGAYLVAYYSAIYKLQENSVVLVLGLLLGALLACAVALFLRGTVGFAFGMLTLAIAQAGYLFAFQTKYLHGADGIVGVTRGQILGISLESSVAFYEFCLVIGLISIAAILFVRKSMAGQIIRAIKDSPDRAASLGLPIRRYQMFAFAFGGALSSVAGVLSGQLVGAVDPTSLYWTTIATPLLGSLIGGIDTLVGPIVGAGIYIMAMDRINVLTANWILWVGLIVLAVAVVAPSGLVPAIESGAIKLWSRLPRREQVRIEVAEKQAESLEV